MTITQQKLQKIQDLINQGLDKNNMREAMTIIGAPAYSAEELAEFKIYSDYLPMSDEAPFSEHQRNLQILWESIDRVPLGLNCAFSIPFRAMIAKALFKKCGDGFIAYQNVLLNFPQLLEVGNNVAFNCGCIIDSKGGVSVGDHSMLAENVTIFSHAHHEEDHMQRDYKRVVIGNHVMLGSGSTIMSGVTMADGSFAGVGAVVTKDVPENTVVAGAPAKPIREAHRAGKTLDECNHFFLKDKAFQNQT